MDRLWVLVADTTADANSVAARELHSIARIANKPKLQRIQQKREESDYSRNFRCLKNKVARNKYYYNVFLAYSPN